MNVWTYWEGPKLPYIDVCLQSMKRVCNHFGINFYIVTPETVSDFIFPGTLHENYLKLEQPALRADCIRAALLVEHGGWWWDADTIALKTPPILKDVSSLYMVWNKSPTRVLNGYIYFQKGHSTAIAWLEKINQMLASDVEAIDWCDLGEKILTEKLVGDREAYQIPRNLFLPIDIDSNVVEFFTKQDFQKHINSKTICYGLNHSWFIYHYPKAMALPHLEWEKSHLLIHQLLHAELVKGELC